MATDEDVKFDQIIQYLKDLNSKIESTEEILIKQMKEMLQDVGQEVRKMKEENKAMKEKLAAQELKITELEDKNRKNNIVIFGVEEAEQNVLELEENLKMWIRDDLQLEIENADINYAFRMGKKQEEPRPIMVACTTWRLKREILKNKKRIMDPRIVVKEDFSRETREERKKLGTIMLKLKEEGKQVSLRGNKLFMEGQYYTKEEINQALKTIDTPESAVGYKKRQRSEEDHDGGVSNKMEKREARKTVGEEANLMTASGKDRKITSFFGHKWKTTQQGKEFSRPK